MIRTTPIRETDQKEKNKLDKDALRIEKTETSKMRVLRSSESQKGKKDKQRLWLKRPMTQRLIFHGKNSEESLVILEGRAPAQATGDGTRLVRVRQSTITTEDLSYLDEDNEVICPTLLGKEALLEVITDQCTENKLETGTRLVLNPYEPVKFAETPLEGKGGRWAGLWASHILLTKETFVATVPNDLSEFAGTTLHTWATAWAACDKILERDEPAIIVVQGAGLLGLYCCGLLSSHAYNVFCCDKNSKRLRLVTEFGAVPLHPSLIGPVESKANYVIECTGDAASAQQAFQWLGEGADYIIAGLSQVNDSLPISGRQIIQKNVRISGVRSYTNEHLQKAVNFVSENPRKYPWHKLTGPNFELSEWNAAVEAARQKEYYRVLFRPEREITPRIVPNIEENETLANSLERSSTNDDVPNDVEPNSTEIIEAHTKTEFQKVPEKMHQTLQEIIKEAVPDEK